MKNTKIILVLISFFAITTIFSGAVSAASWTVNPGSSIQSVINSASSSDTITVNDNNGANYTYSENLVINKNVTLKAKSGGNVTLKSSSSSKPVITINSGGASTTIQGFTIKGATSSDGVYLNGTSKCTITGNTITSNYLGVHLYKTQQNIISQNVIINNNYAGLIFEGSPSNTVQNNNITGNTRGIRIGLIGTTTSNSNTIQNNLLTSPNYSIGIDSSSGTTIKGNTITNGGSYGIFVGITYSSNNTLIQNNTITNNQYGIYVNGSTANIHFNRITGNTLYGLYTMGNGVVNATDNWWGSNTPTVSSTNGSDIYIAKGTVTYNPWLVLNINSTDGTPDVTADLTTDNNGNNTSSNGTLPDGIPINFNTTLGTIGTTSYTSKGKATSTLNANNTYGTATVSVTLDNQTVSKTILTYNIYDITTQKGFTTIQDALNDSSTSNGDIIKLENGTYNGLGNVNLTINKNVTIIGSGSTIIDSQGSGQAFIIPSNVNATINDITFINGNMVSTDAGGAICNGGTLNVIGCTFKNNTAFNGGAVVNGGTLTVTNSTFISNTAGHDGAAINNLNTLTVINCNFLNNSASHVAGGIMNWHGTLNVTGSSFTGNTATTEGSAISNYGPANINFNRIVGNGNYQLYNSNSAIMNATNNWWGQNNGPTVSSTSPSDIYITSGTVTYDPWLVLSVTVNPTSTNDNSIVTADLTHNNNGGDTSPSGNVPDGIPVNFTTNLGTITSPAYTKNGKISTTFSRSISTSGTATLTVTFDKQSAQTTIVIDTTSPTVNASLTNGTYSTYQNVTLTATDNVDPNPAIYYTLDGTTPTTSSTPYTTPISIVKDNTILSFIAVDIAGNQASIQTRNYTINLPIMNLNTNKVYSTIQGAIDEASTNDTIQVSNGTYIENIILNKSLTLTAISLGNVTIQPLNTSNPVITINSGGINSLIQGFNINGAINSYGIYMNLADNITILGNNITNNLYGIYINSSNNNTITGNNIANNQNTGIYLNNSSTSVNYNRIAGNTIYGLDNEGNGAVDATNNWWGSNAGPSTTPNNINNNGGTVHYDPWLILSITSSSIRVTHNNYTSDLTVDLTHNNLGVDTSSIGNVPDGIVISFITTLGCINATAVTTDGLALVTLNSSVTQGLANVTATLDNQTLSVIPRVFSTIQAAVNDNSTSKEDIIEIEDGIYIENIVLNKGVTIVPVNKGNVIVVPLDPSKPVISISSGGSGSLIQDLNIYGRDMIGGRGAYGVFVDSANNCSITGDNISGSQFGIYFNNSVNSTISESNVTSNCNGIYIFNSSSVTVSESVVSNNTGNGIYIDTSSSTEISKNTISNNILNGIYINNSLNSTISENNLLSNQLDGVYSNNSSATINFNRIIGNRAYGIENQGNNTIDVTNNWWGSNNGPVASNDIVGIVNSSSWLVLGLTSSHDSSNSNSTSYSYVVTADLSHDNSGNDTSPLGHVPDGIPVNFATNLGTITTPASTRNGKAVTTLNGTASGTVNVTATLDDQRESTSFTIVTGHGIINNRTNTQYDTIQSAIDDPTTLNGDTIFLGDGTYTENIVIDKNITLSAVPGANVIINPADTTEPTITVNSSGNGSTIMGLNISSGLCGIDVCSASSNILGNNVTDNAYGIYLETSNSTTVTENSVKSNFYGIYLVDSNNNEIRGNSLEDNFEGICLDSSNSNMISGNNVTDGWDGIYLSDSNNDTVTLNNITGTGIGIGYLNSNNTIISGNNITNSVIQDVLQIDPTGIVMSTDIFNCGPASLATVMQNFGINVTQDELANFAGTDDTGTTMYGLVQAAQEEGLTARGLKLTLNQLIHDNNGNYNYIVYLTINGEGHFSVLKNITDSTVYLADSDLGNVNMTYADFTAAFIQDTVNGYGYVLVVTNDSNNPQLSNGINLADDEMQNIRGTRYNLFSSLKNFVKKVVKVVAVKAKGLWAKVSKVRYSKVKYSNGNSKWKKYATCYKSHNDYLHIKKGLNYKHHLSKTFKNRLRGGGSIVLGLATCTAGVALSECGVGEILMAGGSEIIIDGSFEVLFGREL